SHLDPFFTAAKNVPPRVDELKVLLQRDAHALQTIDHIEPVIARHVKVMKDMVDLGNKNLFRGGSQRKLTDEGNTLMEEIRTTFSTLEKSQRELLSQQQTALTALADRMTSVSLAGSVLAACLLVAFGVWALHAMHGRGKAQEKLDRFLGSMPDALVIVN